MDYKLFLQLIEDELEYLQENSLCYEPDRLKAAGALIVLQEWATAQLQEACQGTILPGVQYR